MLCAFNVGAPQQELDSQSSDSTELADASSVLGEHTLEEYAAMDEAVVTTEPLSDDWEKRIFQAARGENVESEDDSEDDDTNDFLPATSVTGAVSWKEAQSSIETLKKFGLHRGMADFVADVEQLGDYVNKSQEQERMKLPQVPLNLGSYIANPLLCFLKFNAQVIILWCLIKIIYHQGFSVFVVLCISFNLIYIHILYMYTYIGMYSRRG